MNRFSAAAKAFIAVTILAGGAVLLYGLAHLRPASPLQFLLFLALGIVASRLKVKLPGVSGSMSVNLPFFLIAAAKLSVGETLVIAFAGTLAQSLDRRRGNKPVSVLFNAAALTNSIALAVLAFTRASQHHLVITATIVAAGAAYFLANTVLMMLVLWLAEGERPLPAWVHIVELTVPYYLLGASIAAAVCGVENVGWTIALVVLAAMYLTYRSYRVYFTRSSPQPESMAKAAGV